MKREFKNFFSKKYVLIILLLLIVASILLWHSSTNLDNSDTSYSNESVYSNFIDVIKPYDSQEDLKEQYENLKTVIPGMIANNNNEKYASLLYEFCIENQLPYDSLVDFSEKPKYTQFHYLGNFKAPIMIFILLASLLIGGFYQTSEVMNKTSKIIYSSGEKRTRIIDRKYGTSLLVIIAIVFVFETIIALLGLIYSNSGAKYCILYAGGNSLYHLNYFQYYCLFLANHLIALLVTYTFIYYLSVVCKNGIIPVCACFSLLLVYALMQTKTNNILIFDILIRGGFVEVFYNRDKTSAVNLNNLFLYIPILLLPIITFGISRIFIKKADYSR